MPHCREQPALLGQEVLAILGPQYESIGAGLGGFPGQQAGLHAGKFDAMRLSKDSEGMISNYHRLIDGYIAGLDPQRLAEASRRVNCGFESSIIDIGI